MQPPRQPPRQPSRQSSRSPRPTQGRRRAYGQHFLKDRGVSARIAGQALSLARTHGSHTLLEIGPGRGAITEPLLARIAEAPGLRQLILCEKDRALAARWQERAASREAHAGAGETSASLAVLDSDFLELPPETWLAHAPLTVVSNLPYSSGTAIFTKLARHPGKIQALVLMFQSEVAQRLRAERGSKDWGSLSLWTQNQWSVKKLLHVPPGAFSPPPQVQSEVVTLEPLAQPRIARTQSAEGERTWDFLLKSCFQHRRKMLRAGLPKAGNLRNALELSGVDDTKRAEALDWDEWGKLFKALLEIGRVASTGDSS